VVATASRCWGFRPERKSTTGYFRIGACESFLRLWDQSCLRLTNSTRGGGGTG
jgi:hypothetical protein